MYCTVCGEYNENTSAACSSCGAPLRSYDDPSEIDLDRTDARFNSSRDGLTEPASTFEHTRNPHADDNQNQGKSAAQNGNSSFDVEERRNASPSREDSKGSSRPAGKPERETPELTERAMARRKKASVPIMLGAVVIAALLAAVILSQLGLPTLSDGSPNSNQDAEQSDASESEGAAPSFEGVDFQTPFDMSDLLTSAPEEASAMLGDLCEYSKYFDDDQYAYTANWDMARYFESRPSFDQEYEDGIAWNVSVNGGVNDYLRVEDLDAGDIIEAVDFEGRFHREPEISFMEGDTHGTDGRIYTAALTCEEAAQIVSNAYEYDYIALCKEEHEAFGPLDLQKTDSWIEGYAIKGDTVAYIQVLHDPIRPKSAYEIDMHVLEMPSQDNSEPSFNQQQAQEYYDYCMYLCLDDTLSNKCTDFYVVAPKSQTNQDSSAEHHAVVYHHGPEEEHNFTTDTLESSFGMPFDVGNLITSSREEILDATEGLCCPFDGEMLSSNDNYYANEWGYTANSSNYGWWELYLYRAKTESDSINQMVSRSDIEDGAEVCEAQLTVYVAASDPSCEDVAKLVSDAYGYDRIVLYSYYGSHEHVEGFAVTDDTIASIDGEAITSSTSTIGSYKLEIDVLDETSEWEWNKCWESANVAFDENPPKGLRDSYIG